MTANGSTSAPSSKLCFPALDGLDERAREELAHVMRPASYRRGERLFEAGERGADAMYVIVRGSVDLLRPAGNGHHTVATLHAGSVLGETSLLLPGPHTVSAVAAGPVDTLVLDYSSFSRLVAERSHAALALALHLGAALASRLRRMNDAVSALLARGDSTPIPNGPVLSDIERFRHQIMHEWQV